MHAPLRPVTQGEGHLPPPTWGTATPDQRFHFRVGQRGPIVRAVLDRRYHLRRDRKGRYGISILQHEGDFQWDMMAQASDGLAPTLNMEAVA
jgi:hypothetical protein